MPLQWIEPVDRHGRARGRPLVAVDTIGSGPGELVYFITAREATLPLRERMVAVDASIIGCVDHVRSLDRAPCAGHAQAPPPAAAPSVTPALAPARGGAGQGGSAPSLARYVDHTLLRATATSAEIVKLCREARQHSFAAVCINPAWVELAAAELEGSPVAVGTVVSFPLGASATAVKVREAEDAIARGATELDMVAPLGRIKEGAWAGVEADIRAVVAAAAGRALVKVILETAALEPMEIIKAAALCREAGARFVKTSTGFHPAGGATPEAVALLRMAVGRELGVKASGGVRSCDDALRMIAAGATRIGTSSGIELVSCYGHLAPPIDEAVRRLGFRAPTPAVAY